DIDFPVPTVRTYQRSTSGGAKGRTSTTTAKRASAFGLALPTAQPTVAIHGRAPAAAIIPGGHVPGPGRKDVIVIDRHTAPAISRESPVPAARAAERHPIKARLPARGTVADHFFLIDAFPVGIVTARAAASRAAVCVVWHPRGASLPTVCPDDIDAAV